MTTQHMYSQTVLTLSLVLQYKHHLLMEQQLILKDGVPEQLNFLHFFTVTVTLIFIILSDAHVLWTFNPYNLVTHRD